MNKQTETFWQNFKLTHNLTAHDLIEACQFGDNKETADELANLINHGIKTATTSAYELYESNDPVPKVGKYTIILDGNDLPICVVKDVVVEIIQYDLISAEHAYHEGDGDRSYQYWRKVHDQFFQQAYLEENKNFTPQIKCLCEVFEVVK